ncbi:hypothetical protein GCM10011507_14110 [Edaphobacter acidisoli]|uniref:Tetratricopeptide repeat protein n=2 Tax=Edaphobacter acidisoli TaxID=2040573 RepID=A0A916RNZ8_9BACT|nr:hypothetical protein GCM10011507_14110 [Edaphobacter acidisoli]
MTGLPIARLYWQLGMSYEDAGEIGRADATLQHAEALFRQSDSKGGELAEALDSLAVLDGATGRVPDAMKEELEALQLRQKLGNRLLMARSWNTLGALALKQKKFDQARAFSQKAADEFEGNKDATLNDKLAARYGLGMALCGQKDYTTAVSVLKNAVTDARSMPSVEPIPIGIGEFLLGYAYWHSGDATDAGIEMKTGVNTLNAQLGWGAPSYVQVLKIYAKYLHLTRNVEEANEVDRRIQQADSVVSVGALQSSAGVFGFDSLR